MEPSWDSPETRELVVRACYDCHSNETVWPWYSNVAPLSWLIQRDVEKGRKEVNYSEWDRPQEEVQDSGETVREGTMPPWYYAVLRTKARLSTTERKALIRGLDVTLGPVDRGEGEEDEEYQKREEEK